MTDREGELIKVSATKLFYSVAISMERIVK